MEVCLARGVRLGAALIGLLAITVGGYVTFWLLSWAWTAAYQGHALLGSAILAVAALATPVAASIGWRTGSTRPALERFTIASALVLPVALTTGLVVLAWMLIQPAPY